MAITLKYQKLLKYQNPTDAVFQHRSQHMKQNNLSTLITFQPLHCEGFRVNKI